MADDVTDRRDGPTSRNVVTIRCEVCGHRCRDKAGNRSARGPASGAGGCPGPRPTDSAGPPRPGRDTATLLAGSGRPGCGPRHPPQAARLDLVATGCSRRGAPEPAAQRAGHLHHVTLEQPPCRTSGRCRPAADVDRVHRDARATARGSSRRGRRMPPGPRPLRPSHHDPQLDDGVTAGELALLGLPAHPSPQLHLVDLCWRLGGVPGGRRGSCRHAAPRLVDHLVPPMLQGPDDAVMASSGPCG